MNVTATHYHSSSESGVGLAAGPGDVEVLNFVLQLVLELTVPSGTTDTYTISGIVTEYLGGPISGATVSASSGNASIAAVTDAQGRYILSKQFSGSVGLSVSKTGYTTAWKNTVSASESTVDFVLHPGVEVTARGDTLAGIIYGDEYIAGDDVLFGGSCSRVPCKVVRFKEHPTPRVQVSLRFAPCATCPCHPHCVGDGSSRLALYVTARPDLEDGPPYTPIPPGRYCCSYSSNEPVVAAFNVPYLGYIAIAFERTDGALSAAFELTVRPD